jgi:hypothetical protein
MLIEFELEIRQLPAVAWIHQLLKMSKSKNYENLSNKIDFLIFGDYINLAQCMQNIITKK